MLERENLWAMIGRFTVRGLFLGMLLGGLYGTCIFPVIGTILGAILGTIVGFVLGAVNGCLLAFLMFMFAPYLGTTVYPTIFAICNGAFSFPGALFGFSLFFPAPRGGYLGGSNSLLPVIIPSVVTAFTALWTSYRINMSYLDNPEKPKNKPKRKPKSVYWDAVSAEPALYPVIRNEWPHDVY
jgi:hypothetical protein